MKNDTPPGRAISQHTSQHAPDAEKLFSEKFERLMTACGAKTDSDFARILDIKPSSVGGAKRRHQLPPAWIEQIAQRFEVNADWLFFGFGPMRRGGPAPPPLPTQASPEPLLTQPKEEFRMSDMLTKTAEVLESETIYRTALASNINAFHQAVQGERLLAELSVRVETLEKQMVELQRENRELRRRLEPPEEKHEVGAVG